MPAPADLGDGLGRPAGRRFSIYRNNVAVGLVEALEQTFPATRALVGEAAFYRAARNFVLHHPPGSPLMMHYGQSFPAFLAAFPPLREVAAAGALATAEVAWMAAFHAPDAPALRPEALNGVAPEEVGRLRFAPHPAASVHFADAPLADLLLVRNGHAPPPATAEPQGVLVSRPQLDVLCAPLSRSQWMFFSGLFAGATLGDVVERQVVGQENEAAFDLAATLALAWTVGAFADFSVVDA